MFVSAIRMSLVTLLLCGLAYPLAVTGIAQLTLPHQANGSLVETPKGTVIGSELIAQKWQGPQWFQARPSAADYKGDSSTGSNFGPTSKALAKRIHDDRAALEKVQPALAGRELPADMLTDSGSGLDPDITPANAYLQAPRVAKARHLPEAQVKTLVDQHVKGRQYGLLGEPRVNVLELNVALQQAGARS